MKKSSLANLNATSLGLNFDDNTQYLYGYYQDYPFYLRENFEGAFALFTSVIKGERVPDEELRENLLNHPAKLVDTVTLTNYQFSVLFKSSTQSAELQKTVSQVLDWVVQHLKAENWQVCCEETGQTDSLGLYALDRQVRILTEKTYQAAASKITTKKLAPERLVLGIIGAVLGGIFAGALLLYVAFQGYAIGLLGFLVGILTVLGYKLLAGKFSIKSIITCTSLLLLLVIAINELDLAVFFVKKQGLDDIGQAFTDIYKNKLAVRDSLYWNNLWTLAATSFVGAGALSALLLKKSNRQITCRRLDA